MNNDDDDNHNHKKRKSKKASTTTRLNPLAAARPKPKTPESLWHVKSGAGYQLFCDYYQRQPPGVVCGSSSSIDEESVEKDAEGDDATTSLQQRNDDSTTMRKRSMPTGAASSSTTNTGSCCNTGKGLSRASKRRKRKKGGDDSGESATTAGRHVNAASKQTRLPAATDPSTSIAVAATASTATSRVINERLLEEMDFATMSSSSSHSSTGFWEFLQTLTRPMPVTFRLRSHLSAKGKQTLLDQLATYQTTTTTIPTSCDKMDAHPKTTRVEPVVSFLTRDSDALSSLSSSNNYKLTVCSISDAQLLKHPHHASLAAFLQQGTMNGSLARQEFGSLLPVLAVRHHVEMTAEQQQPPIRIRRVLDLCSAPGSKTLQLIEWMMERQQQQQQGATDKPVIIRANDVNPRRLEELKEAIQRSGVLTTNTALAVKLRFTNQDASRYADDKKKVLYDVILADVPCSGDGTVRKDARVLPYWTPRTAMGLHELQVNILCRALQLLAVNGIAVYSTCSLNPIENEAVVAAAVRRLNRSQSRDSNRFQLRQVAIPELLQSRHHRRGVSTWKVADYSASSNTAAAGSDDDDAERACLAWYDTFEQAKAAKIEGAVSTMWPSNGDEQEAIRLETCLRLWPQDNNTGGFFVAMIQRTR